MLNIYELYLKQSRDELTFIQAFPFAARVFWGSPTHRWFWCPRTWHGTWTHSNALGIGDDSKKVVIFEMWLILYSLLFWIKNISSNLIGYWFIQTLSKVWIIAILLKWIHQNHHHFSHSPPKKGGFVASYRSNTVNSTPGSLVPSL